MNELTTKVLLIIFALILAGIAYRFLFVDVNIISIETVSESNETDTNMTSVMENGNQTNGALKLMGDEVQKPLARLVMSSLTGIPNEIQSNLKNAMSDNFYESSYDGN